MRKWLTIISGALTAAICAVMNLMLIPQIEAGTGGVRCFDMNFAYSYDTAKEFLSLLTDEGRQIYLCRQLPLDFVYPVAYGLFFGLLIYTLSRGRKALLIFPALLVASDYIENICVMQMLKSADISRTLVSIASIATTAKTILMYVCVLLIAALIVYYFKTKKKKE